MRADEINLRELSVLSTQMCMLDRTGFSWSRPIQVKCARTRLAEDGVGKNDAITDQEERQDGLGADAGRVSRCSLSHACLSR